MHSVYHFYDGNGDILYVGMSANPFARADQHRIEKDMLIVARIEIKWFDARGLAKRFERQEVSSLKPPWNVKMTGRPAVYCKQKDVGPPTQEEIDKDDRDLRRVLGGFDV